MSVAIVTGDAGLVGSRSVRFFSNIGMDVVGIDNDMRGELFGDEASTKWKSDQLKKTIESYEQYENDIRNYDAIDEIFERFGSAIELVVHTAAQPSHDWAANDPQKDFTINANGTLNLLEATRRHCKSAVFIFTSTNKVYGDNPNNLPFVEKETRWEVKDTHRYADGIDESMSIDQCMHSLFGSSKVAADILVQEYGRYYGMKTASFRGGCLTGPSHSGTELHGFLSYLMKCVATDQKYTVFGHKAKQVRDNIHSRDLVRAFYQFFNSPRVGEVYNIGGGRYSNCSMLEAIQMCENITGNKLQYTIDKDSRPGDHIWYVSDLSKFKSHYPRWSIKNNVEDILREIYKKNKERWEI